MAYAVAYRQCSDTQVTKQTCLPTRSTAVRKPLLSLYLAVIRAALCNHQLWPFGPEKIKFLKLSQMNGLDK